MNRYGQAITWGTASAPHLFTGESNDYSYRDNKTRQLDMDEAGDNRALILHSRKAEISFSAKVSVGSTDFLDLSAGAAIVISGLDTGTVLCRRASERWALLQPKVASIQATHYPDLVQATPDLAGVALTAFTPAGQTQSGLVFPGGVIIYSTVGLTHASGVVHMVELNQELQITEDEPSPAGTILGATTHGYLRTLGLDLLATAAAPANGSVLTLTGAPSHAADYRIEEVETRYTVLRGKMYALKAVWIPPLSA